MRKKIEIENKVEKLREKQIRRGGGAIGQIGWGGKESERKDFSHDEDNLLDLSGSGIPNINHSIRRA